MRNMDVIEMTQTIGRKLRLGAESKTYGLCVVPVYSNVGVVLREHCRRLLILSLKKVRCLIVLFAADVTVSELVHNPDFPLNLCHHTSTKNTHIEHSEDLILDGKDAALNVINFLEFIYEGDAGNMASVKYDGAPAVVFGTNPENGKFFVGTKSVFNKKTLRSTIPWMTFVLTTSQRIRNVLTLCLMYLPKVNGIFQGDFMGVGNGNVAITPILSLTSF